MVKKLSKEKTADLLKELRTSMSVKFIEKFKEAFQAECRNANEYITLPTRERTYYLVFHLCRPEALFGINFNSKQDPVESYSISSFARIIEKDINTAPGWWYLKEIIEKVLLPTCYKGEVKRVCARIESVGGKKTFEDLKKSSPTDYTIVVGGNSGTVEVKKKHFV